MLRTRKSSTRRAFAASVLALGMVVGLAACGSGSSDSGASGESGAGTGSLKGDGELLKVFMPSTSNVYLAAAAEAAKVEAKKLGFKISVVENNFDQTEEDQQIQEWLATGEKAAAVMIWPASAANATASIRALSRVAPVLQWNQLIAPAAEEFIKIGYAGVSDIGIGDQAGKDTLAQIEKLKAKKYKFQGPNGLPNVLEISLGSGDYAAGEDRHTGYMKVVEGKVNMLGREGAATFDAQGAFKAASTAIPKYLSKGIDFIYVQTNDMGNGVVQAAEQNGLKPGKNVFLNTGTSSGSMDNLRSGKITTAVLQPPAIEGTLIVDNVARYLAAGKSEDGETTIPSDETKPELSEEPPTRVTFMMNPSVSADNIDSFKIWGLNFSQLMGEAAS